MHLRQESVSIAGGIVLFLIGIRMIFPPPEGLMGEMPGRRTFHRADGDPAGGRSLGHGRGDADGQRRARPGIGDWSMALLLAWGATAAILFSATLLYKLLGPRALIALERLMGMLLVAISVQMFLDGLATYLQTRPPDHLVGYHATSDLATVAHPVRESVRFIAYCSK